MFLHLKLAIAMMGSKKDRRFVSFIFTSAFLGIALGVALLITVLSVMNGFEASLKEKILGSVPHMKVYSKVSPQSFLKIDWQVSEVKSGEALVVHQGNMAGFIFQGRNQLPSHITLIEGALPDEKTPFGVVISESTAHQKGLKLGDKFAVVMPEVTATPAGLYPRMRRLEVTGMYQSGLPSDSVLAFLRLEDAGKLFARIDHQQYWEVKTPDPFDVPEVTSLLRNEGWYVIDWTDEHGAFFEAIRLEKTMMFAILSMIIAVACFNLVSSMVMVVREKQNEVAILKTIGATHRLIYSIFTVQGLVVGGVGTLLGLLLGSFLSHHVGAWVAWIESNFGVVLVSQSVYFVDHLPSLLKVSDMAQVGGIAFILTVIATIYPSYRALKVEPAASLRYE